MDDEKRLAEIRDRAMRGEDDVGDLECLDLLAMLDAERRRAESAEAKLAALREAAQRSFVTCPFDCTIESYCGRCAHLVEALAVASPLTRARPAPTARARRTPA